jgi:RNA recognition motif-containing protein
MATTIYIGNVPDSADEKSLEKEFSACGDVTSVNVVKDRATGLNKGYAFIEMPEDEEALKAIAKLNGKRLDNSEIVVSVAKPNTSRRGKRGQGPANRGPDGHPGLSGGRDNRW